MNIYKMTFKQYCQNYLENCRYKKVYETDPQKWAVKKESLLTAWVDELKELALLGPLPAPVLMSFIRQFGEAAMFRTFQGIYAPGISHFRIPASVRKRRAKE